MSDVNRGDMCFAAASCPQTGQHDARKSQHSYPRKHDRKVADAVNLCDQGVQSWRRQALVFVLLLVRQDAG